MQKLQAATEEFACTFISDTGLAHDLHHYRGEDLLVFRVVLMLVLKGPGSWGLRV